jgi:hypothetical protein
VQRAAMWTLVQWYDDFLAESERRHGLAEQAVQRPRSYQIASSLDGIEDRQFPVVAVTSPGVQDHEWTSTGRLDGWVQLIVGVGVEAASPDAAQDLAKIHLHAIRQLMIAHPSLGGTLPITGFAIDDAAEYDDAEFQIAGRKAHRASGVIALLLWLEGLAYKGAGPDTPTRAQVVKPPADPVTATATRIDITT